MTAKLKIIAKAVIIRMNNGENIEDVLKSYPALTSTDRAEIKQYIESMN